MAGPGPHADEELTDGPASEPRPSASLILLRDARGGPEVLLVQRGPAQRFMAGAWVFPGGSTAQSDADERATAVRELAEEATIELAPGAELVRFSRWITPARVKRRFDTHFFVAAAPDEAVASPDGAECVDARWLAPRDALAAGEREELLLVFPTIKHLEALADFASVAQALEHARSRHIEPVEPELLVEGGVARVRLPGEPGYGAP